MRCRGERKDVSRDSIQRWRVVCVHCSRENAGCSGNTHSRTSYSPKPLGPPFILAGQGQAVFLSRCQPTLALLLALRGEVCVWCELLLGVLVWVWVQMVHVVCCVWVFVGSKNHNTSDLTPPHQFNGNPTNNIILPIILHIQHINKHTLQQNGLSPGTHQHISISGCGHKAQQRLSCGLCPAAISQAQCSSHTGHHRQQRW